jgi:hypothetical protein
LQTLRSRKLLLGGDSITRNMFHSLKCLLTADPEIAMQNGKMALSMFFPEYNVHIAYSEIPYLTWYHREAGAVFFHKAN